MIELARDFDPEVVEDINLSFSRIIKFALMIFPEDFPDTLDVVVRILNQQSAYYAKYSEPISSEVTCCSRNF